MTAGHAGPIYHRQDLLLIGIVSRKIESVVFNTLFQTARVKILERNERRRGRQQKLRKAQPGLTDFALGATGMCKTLCKVAS
jgi:hypothetical protein